MKQGVRRGRVALCFAEVGHRHPPSVRLLRKASGLAEVCGAVQVFLSGRGVASLPGDAAQRHPHVRGAAQDRLAASSAAELQAATGGAVSLVQATQLQLQIHQRHGAGEHV